MATSCPLNFQKVDENISRLSTLLVILLVVLYLYTSNIILILFLIIDFSMRLFMSKKGSLIVLLAKNMKKIIHIKDNFVDGGAKRLAAYFGMSFMILFLINHFFGNWSITLSLAILYLTCAVLDVFFHFCIGCKIYFIIKKIYPSFMEN